MNPSDLGTASGGVWKRADAVRAGLSPEQVRRRLERGEWQRVRRGVMTDGGITPDALMRGWAAVVAAGGAERARATGRTTARLLALPLIDDADPATGSSDAAVDDVLVPVDTRLRQRPTLRVFRSRLGEHQRVRLGGCPSLSLEAALPHLAAVLSPEALVCLLDAALHRGLLEPARLPDVVDRRGARYTSVLRRAVALADRRAESPAETLARLLLLPVLPGLVPQVRLLDSAYRVVARFDLADEGLRLAVEVDGKAGHAGAEMAARDHRRDRKTATYGWTTERCTWWELRRDQPALRRRVLATAERLDQRRAA